MITLAHNALVVLVVLFIYPPDWSFVQLLSLAGIALVAANLWWLSLTLGMLGARYRDLDPLVAAAMPLLFFLSPVVFNPEHLTLQRNVVWLNPLTYFIAVIREPIQGKVPDAIVYGVVLAVLAVGWTAAFWLLTRRSARVAFWV